MNSFIRKILSVFCIIVLITAMYGCSGGNEAESDDPQATNGDLRKLMMSHTLVVGVTDYEPLSYLLDDGTRTGFDVELASRFGEYMGVNVQFTEIEWDKKTEYLENGKIDCLWNGMTATSDLDDQISLSSPYLSNSQVIVMKTDQFKKYDSVKKCVHLLFGVEIGSAGQDVAKDNGYRTILCTTQKDAIKSVSEGRCDAAIIDNIMAESLVGEGNEFEELSFDYPLSSEQFVVGFRKTSPLTKEVNTFLKEFFGTDEAKSLGDKYNLTDSMIYMYD